MTDFERCLIHIIYDRLNQAREHHLDRYSKKELQKLLDQEIDTADKYFELSKHFFDKSMIAEGKEKEYLENCSAIFRKFYSMSFDIQTDIRAELGKRGERIP